MRPQWIALIICAAASTAFSQALPQSLRDCAAEPDGPRRLSCYDREVARLGSPGAGQNAAAQPLAAPAPLAPAQEFGMNEERIKKLKPLPPVPQSLTAHVSAITPLPYGRQRFVLDNSQVWEQTEEDWGFAPQTGAAVTISRGKLGGFWMATDSYKEVRVKRIR